MTIGATYTKSVCWGYETFPHIPEQALDRPHREVGLLIGQDNVSLLPWGGDGYILVGNQMVKMLETIVPRRFERCVGVRSALSRPRS